MNCDSSNRVITDPPGLDPSALRKITVISPHIGRPLFIGKPVHKVPIPVVVSGDVVRAVASAMGGKNTDNLEHAKFSVTDFEAEKGVMTSVTLIPERRAVERLLLPQALSVLGITDAHTDLISVIKAVIGNNKIFEEKIRGFTPKSHLRELGGYLEDKSDLRRLTRLALVNTAAELIKRLVREFEPVNTNACALEKDNLSRLCGEYFIGLHPTTIFDGGVDAQGILSVKKNDLLSDHAVYGSKRWDTLYSALIKEAEKKAT